MPSLPDQLIRAKAKDETEFRSKVTCSVTSDGKFRIAVPEELKTIASRRIAQHDLNKNHVGYAKGIERLEASTLRHLTDFLQECAEEFLNVEEITERLILYRETIEVHAWEGADGRLYPCGGYPHPPGNWWMPALRGGHQVSSSNMIDSVGVGLVAKVFDKTTFKRPSGETVRWKLVSTNGEKDPAVIGLNSFHQVKFPTEGFGIKPYRSMPYTPQAAEFFRRMMLAICKLGIELDAFFASDERLNAAIQSGGMPALMGGSEKP